MKRINDAGAAGELSAPSFCSAAPWQQLKLRVMWPTTIQSSQPGLPPTSHHQGAEPSGIWPVYRSDDEGDGGEADGRGGPLADGEGPPGGLAQQVQRRGAHAVDGEARDDDRGQGLPHKRVHHRNRHPGRLPRVVPVSLRRQDGGVYKQVGWKKIIASS